MRPVVHPLRRARLRDPQDEHRICCWIGSPHHAHFVLRAGLEFVCGAYRTARDWRSLRGQADVVQEQRFALAGLSRAQRGGQKRFPDAGLLPRDDVEADAQALSWMSFAASTLHPARRRGLDHARQVWGIADRRLGNGWALGRFSIADIHLFRLYWRFANSLKPAPGTFPSLTAHYARMMARPAVQRTIAIESAIGYELPA
jgi:hypothetical protein